jgi:hypothetical protein
MLRIWRTHHTFEVRGFFTLIKEDRSTWLEEVEDKIVLLRKGAVVIAEVVYLL